MKDMLNNVAGMSWIVGSCCAFVGAGFFIASNAPGLKSYVCKNDSEKETVEAAQRLFMGTAYGLYGLAVVSAGIVTIFGGTNAE